MDNHCSVNFFDKNPSITNWENVRMMLYADVIEHYYLTFSANKGKLCDKIIGYKDIATRSNLVLNAI